MTKVQEHLLQILSDVLWKKTSVHEYSEEEWEDILSTAENQGVLFLVLQGCTSIRQQLSPESWMKWRSKMISTMVNNELLMETQSKVIDCMYNAGIPCAVLKGSSISVCYYNPAVRALGDIDLLIPAQWIERASEILVSQGFYAPKDSFTHPYHIDFYKKGVVIELHYEVSTFPDSAAGREAKRYLESWQEQIQQKHIGNDTFPCLSDSQQALSLLIHMERHMTNGCIGLRQLCDWTVFLTSITPDYFDKQIIPELKLCGLAKFATMLTQTAVCFLGLDSAYEKSFLLVHKCYVQAMLEEIFREGSVHNKNNTEDSSSFFVEESGTKSSFWVFISKMNLLAHKKFPFTEKLPFMLPLFWLYLPLRYWFRSLLGKRRRKSFLRTISITKQRKKLYRVMNLFNGNQER